MKRVSIVFAGTLLLGTIVNASSLTKKINATFRNIQVFYQNEPKTMEQEPFIYNDSVYLPVRAVAELVDKNVIWNSATNSVFVTDKGASSAELEAKDFEISRLKAEKLLLEKKVKDLEENKKEDDKKKDFKETLDLLNRYYDREHSIEWEFKLSESTSGINVDVSFDSRYDDRKWTNLTKSERERFFLDIAKEIRTDFKGETINGRVMDQRSNKEIGIFTYSRNNSFSYSDNSATSFTELETALKRLYTKIDKSDIPIDDIVITGNEDNITFTLYVDLYTPLLRYEWEKAAKDNRREIRDLMIDLREDIKYDYRYADVQGFIEDFDSRDTLIKFDGRGLY